MSTGTPVATATVNGVVATSAMSSQQIFNMHLEAQGAAPVDFKAGARSGPPLHVHADHTGGGLADAQATAAKAAPTPQQLERQNALPTPQAQAAKVADFDREMQAAGLQSAPSTAQVPAGQVDTAGIAALNKGYSDKITQFERMDPSSFRDKNIESTRAQYHEEMQEFHEGRKLGESRAQFQARRDGAAPTPAPAAATPGAWSTGTADGKRALTPAGKQLQADLLNEYNALPPAERAKATVKRDYQTGLYNTLANERGELAAGHFMAKDLCGYKLPAGDYSPGILRELGMARAMGLSQAQVEAAIRVERGEA